MSVVRSFVCAKSAIRAYQPSLMRVAVIRTWIARRVADAWPPGGGWPAIDVTPGPAMTAPASYYRDRHQGGHGSPITRIWAYENDDNPIVGRDRSIAGRDRPAPHGQLSSR